MGIKVRVLFFLCPCSCLLASSPRDGVPRLLLFTCWTKLLADTAPKDMKDQKFESYFGRKIAVSANRRGKIGMETLTNDAGVVTRYVFDGQPPELKKQELAKRQILKERICYRGSECSNRGDGSYCCRLVTQGIEKYSKRTVKVVFDVSSLQ
ncbi:hypothetical protein C4D60_Mb08t05550 [Musa balbisiana]|uniref:XPG N-terminal domain-containing protein n=1 Tax=Musa balbisiana TaxID=52838 RepID=A0A4S8K1I9_MUSBA|nr:hypothetical protein C4D60_Mb08t05550 [Musa balbisiana]